MGDKGFEDVMEKYRRIDEDYDAPRPGRAARLWEAEWSTDARKMRHDQAREPSAARSVPPCHRSTAAPDNPGPAPKP